MESKYRTATVLESMIYDLIMEQKKTNQLLEQLLEQKQVRKSRKKVNPDV